VCWSAATNRPPAISSSMNAVLNTDTCPTLCCANCAPADLIGDTAVILAKERIVPDVIENITDKAAFKVGGSKHDALLLGYIMHFIPQPSRAATGSAASTLTAKQRRVQQLQSPHLGGLPCTTAQWVHVLVCVLWIPAGVLH